MGKLFGKVVNLVVLAVLAYAAWYGYSNIGNEPSSSFDQSQRADFDCRAGLRKLAEQQACQASPSCNLSNDDTAALRRLELDIEQNCN